MELLGLAIGLAITGSTVWLGPRTTRALGAVFAGALLCLALRGRFGLAGAAAAGCLAGAAAYARLPPRVLRRIVFLVPSLVLLVYTTTLLMYRAPGSPFAGERAASPHVEAALRAHYGVPEDALSFFLVYMRRLVLEGTFGPALKVQGRTVEELLSPALPISVTLGILALTLALAVGLWLGIRAGLRPRSLEDQVTMGLAMIGGSVPSFVIGSALVIVLALRLRLLPVAGWGGAAELVMPTLTLAFPYTAVVARLARGGTIEVMQESFIRTARAKGLPERDVVLKHALRGAILPVVSYLGPAAAGILTGSFVVETLFGIPGIGQWFVKGAINRDYSVVLGTAILYAALVTGFNLLVDLAYTWLDPRLRGASRPPLASARSPGCSLRSGPCDDRTTDEGGS